MANNEETNQGEGVVGRRDNEDQDEISNIGYQHQNTNERPEGGTVFS